MSENSPSAWAIEYTLAELPHVARALYAKLLPHKIVVFTGDLGLGKTTLIRELLAVAGFGEFAGSPTFALVNSYENSELSLHHLDFYRLRGEAELANLDLEHYLARGNLWIEWGERFAEFLPAPYVQLKFEYVNRARRRCQLLT